MKEDDRKALVWLLDEHDRLKAENAMLWKENDLLHATIRNRQEKVSNTDLMLARVERQLRKEMRLVP